MRTFDFETLVKIAKTLTTPKALSLPISLEEAPYLDKNDGWYIASQRKVIVGDIYKFIFAYNSACGISMEESTNTCIEYAKSKISLHLDEHIKAKEVYYNMKRKEARKPILVVIDDIDDDVQDNDRHIAIAKAMCQRDNVEIMDFRKTYSKDMEFINRKMKHEKSRNSSRQL